MDLSGLLRIFLKERITMYEKDNGLQEESKAVQDGIMSDDELDDVAGGSNVIASDTSYCVDGIATISLIAVIVWMD